MMSPVSRYLSLMGRLMKRSRLTVGAGVLLVAGSSLAGTASAAVPTPPPNGQVGSDGYGDTIQVSGPGGGATTLPGGQTVDYKVTVNQVRPGHGAHIGFFVMPPGQGSSLTLPTGWTAEVTSPNGTCTAGGGIDPMWSYGCDLGGGLTTFDVKVTVPPLTSGPWDFDVRADWEYADANVNNDYSLYGHWDLGYTPAAPVSPPPPPPPVIPPPPVLPQPAPVQTRLGADDRIGTAIKVAEAGYGTGGKQAKVAVLSREDGYADALAGNALAAQKGGPLLLTGSAGLDPRVKAELRARMAPGSTVYVLGGAAALSPQVDADLRALNLVPRRLQGQDRYATSVAIAKEISARPHSVLVATGDDYPDALAAGAAAATDPAGGVVILSDGKATVGAASAYLATGIDPSTTHVYGVGGQGVAALNGIATLRGHFVPLAGLDRFATDLAVASDPTLYPAAPTTVGVATSANWPDALAGGAAVGAAHAPLLLADPSGPAAAMRAWLSGHRATLQTMSVFGGAAVVSQHVATEFGDAAWGAGRWSYRAV